MSPADQARLDKHCDSPICPKRGHLARKARKAALEEAEDPKAKKPAKKPVASVKTKKTKSGEKKLAMTRKCITCRAYRKALRFAREQGKSETKTSKAAAKAYGAAVDEFDAAAKAAAAA